MMFYEMEWTPDLATCTALLDALCRVGGLEAAGAFFHRMVAKAIALLLMCSEGFCFITGRLLVEATLVSMLSACANLGGADGLGTGMAVHAYIVRHELDLTTFLGTALLDMYGKQATYLLSKQYKHVSSS